MKLIIDVNEESSFQHKKDLSKSIASMICDRKMIAYFLLLNYLNTEFLRRNKEVSYQF